MKEAFWSVATTWLISVVATASNSVNLQQYTLHTGYRMNHSLSNIHTIVSVGDAASTLPCAAWCSQAPQCDAVDWDNNSSSCVLLLWTQGIPNLLPSTQWSVMLPQKSVYNKDCTDVATKRNTSGIYVIKTSSGKVVEVYCDLENDGGGWTVIHRRVDGTGDFAQDWRTYRKGFGDLLNEFWMGNDNIHAITSQDMYILYIDLEDYYGHKTYAMYNTFHIEDETDNYRLFIGNYSGTSGDSLGYHNNMQFSTFDRDNDMSDAFCAQVHTAHAGWWYKSCDRGNLNKRYRSNYPNVDNHNWYIEWSTLGERNKTLIVSASMKIKPVG